MINIKKDQFNQQKQIKVKYRKQNSILVFQFIMGNQCQNSHGQSTNVTMIQSSKTEITNQANIDFPEEYDNPKHNLLGSDFLRKHSYSPNDLHEKDIRQNASSQASNKRKYSLFKIDSIDVGTELENSFEDSDLVIESETNTIREKSNSFPNEIQQSKPPLTDLTNFSPLRTYHSVTFEIRPETFISVKNQNIERYYKLLGKIGQGTYGNVMKAICYRTNQNRAIKILKKHQQKRKQKRNPNGALIELNVLRILDHPNIIKLYQVYSHNDSYFLVTEFCEGGSILDYLKKNRQYSESVVKAIVKQILSALSYLHSAKIAHRDIKLQNIVFIKKVNSKSNNQDVEVKLIDFGQALEMKYSHNNKDKREVGTFTYMAPEVFQGLYSEKCDIWSCGVILWILLTGKNPFKKGSKKQTIESIRSKVLEFRGDFWTDISPNLKQLIRQMLEKNPLKRISAKQALKNSWFNQQKQVLSAQKMGGVVKNLYNYYSEDNLVNVIQSYLTFLKITQEERHEITKVFKHLDQDSNGEIDLNELKKSFSIYADSHNGHQIEYVLKKINMSKNKKINLNEFITAFYNHKELFYENSLQLAFEHFDFDQSGYIDKKELQKILKGCNKQHINILLVEIDKNGDKRISKQEFVSYFKSHKFL